MIQRSILAGASALALAFVTNAAAAQDTAQDPSDVMPESAHDFVTMMLGMTPDGLLEYESIEANGDEGFVMLGAVMTPPGEEESILVNRIEVDRMDWIAIMADEEPSFLTATISGIDIPAALFEEEIGDIGYDFGDRVAADVAIDYERDDQAVDLRDFAITIPDVIGLALALDAQGIPGAEKLENPMMAAGTARLANFSLRLEDFGGLADIIAASAEQFGMDREEALTMVRAQAPMAQMMLQGERGSEIAAALMAIVEDLPNLSNPITLSLSPDQPVTMADFMTATEQDPEMVITRMGLGLDY
ncbi:hypothetical protein [Fodinicurvata sp. EGI_FJ10296]|uniref:hypothetical protein n=1 Tax=Fodinicurvata sp. EGI_FJ10296 TaxID=3231908 RepID=UPI003452BBF2